MYIYKLDDTWYLYKRLKKLPKKKLIEAVIFLLETSGDEEKPKVVDAIKARATGAKRDE